MSSYPQGVAPQSSLVRNLTYTGPNQTLVDMYRHGTMPPVIGSNTVDPARGKIAFNVLYCDGHVATSNSGQEAYKTLRMKFPR
jgi:prepilin-type processing-associated H-X9-DG protein